MLAFLVGVTASPFGSTSDPACEMLIVGEPTAGPLLTEEARVAREFKLGLFETPSKEFRFDAPLSTDWKDDDLVGVMIVECLLDTAGVF